MPQPATEKPRVAWVDYAKGFCIIMVVMMHSTLGTGTAMGGEGFLHEVVTFAKPFRMPDFFLIAGLFLGQTIARDWRVFLDRKVVHFAYFFVLWLAIQVVVKDAADGPRAVAEQFAFGLIEPLGTLWFIYLLPIFFVTTKLLRRVPWPLVFFAAALLETARVTTGWTVIDEFCSRYVYFYAGYVFSGAIFALAVWVGGHKTAAGVGLALWAVVEGLATFVPAPLGAPNFAALPLLSLIAGFAGASAVVASAVLLSQAPYTRWLRYCGRNSIVIYLAFFLPMAATRGAIVHTGVITDIGVASTLVTFAGVSFPLLLYALVRNTPLKFLFARPAIFRLEKPAESPDAKKAERIPLRPDEPLRSRKTSEAESR
ncbi:acyltransferase [Methylovirgula ligni]|uniref:Putative membrane protein YcfT n=1 Tax=Methylovirgula ligni TaxID=569860 RepID=A0A3D9YXK8_9HYPH|nr:acyltransferase family protein [Methylovirgula ligni]QAY94729.1 acyltransferase [Methylovirgula ligni]REF87381.1 putative membrane protein YcfT [Methylovirgula ligni]